MSLLRFAQIWDISYLRLKQQMMIIQNIIKEGATLIDVREEIELVADGSIDCAVHIPMAEVEENLEKIQQMEGPKVVFCRAGGRAEKVIEYLSQNGVSDLYNGGGYEDIKDFV